MDNQTLIEDLKKADITTANTGGVLTAEQAAKFIETTVDQSAFLKQIRIESDIATARDLDIMGVASRLLHKPAESTAPADAKLKGLATSKRTITPVEVMLPYNVSLSYLEQNIAKGSVEEVINGIFAKQFSNDLVDLMFNGDTADAGADKDFLNITDSIVKTYLADANKQVYARNGSTDWKGEVLPNLLKLLPAKYKVNPSELVFLTSFATEEEYRDQLAARNTALGDAYTVEGRRSQFKGINVEPVPTIVDGTIILTNKKNLVAGFGRDLTVYKQLNPRARRVEYTITAKVDFDYVLTDLIVLCQ